MAQPDVSLDIVERLLTTEMPGPIHDLETLLGGSVGRTFGFVAGDEPFVIRFNWRTLGGFGKEKLIEHLLIGTAVPFPHLVKTGTLAGAGLDWAISVRLPGHGFRIDAPDLPVMLPHLFATMDAIHSANLTGTNGFGGFDASGTGRDPSWLAHIRSVREDGPEGGYFPTWETLFRTTILDRDAIDALIRTVEATLPFCPEDRQLVHGDFGFDNVLVEAGRVTGVIDWLNARFGDGLYDVAWLDFWPDPPLGIAEEYIAWKSAQGHSLPHAAERIRCYQAMIAVDSLRFFAYANLPDAYRWLHGRVTRLMTP